MENDYPAKPDLETLLQSVADGIVAIDEGGRITYFNQAAERITGWQRAQALGREADPDQLQQVFINLMNNATEAMEGQGLITLQTALQDQFWVEVKITDNGPGIPKESMSKVFTPFFTTKEVGKGTGLGLSIVYGIIKLHRGQIAVQSEVGKGTTFTITLPLRIPTS